MQKSSADAEELCEFGDINDEESSLTTPFFL